MASGQWLILELNDIEDLGYKEIEIAIISVFGDGVEYFIPIHNECVGSYNSSTVLMEGYVFIKDCVPVRDRLLSLREHRVFSRVLNNNGRYQTVSSETVAGLKRKLKGTLKRRFLIGSEVKILDGIFKNLIGEVMSNDDGKKIVVRIKRISREIITTVPSTVLEEVNK